MVVGLVLPSSASAATAYRSCAPPPGNDLIFAVSVRAYYPAGYLQPATFCRDWAAPTIRAYWLGNRRHPNGFTCATVQGATSTRVTCRTSWVRTGIGRSTVYVRFAYSYADA
jgi:hypothetical protein